MINKTGITFLTVFCVVLLSSCMKEKNFRTITLRRAEYKLKTEVREKAKFQEPRAIKAAGNFVLYQSIMFINEKEEGIHMVDYSDPMNPVNRGFLPIPGNTGLSIRNGFLYADCYGDLFVFKLSADFSTVLANVISNAFTDRYSAAGSDRAFEIIWHSRDTTVSEEYFNMYRHEIALSSTQPSPLVTLGNIPGSTSVGSSMALFTIVGSHLYTVDQQHLYTFDLADPANPVQADKQHVNWEVETIYPFKDHLFIGSTTGMFVYNIHEPSHPKYVSQFNHVRRCDPVIADGDYAFVTLRINSNCFGNGNELLVLDISDIKSPKHIHTYNFSNPHGLSKDGKVLFLCDGASGLKVLDAESVQNIQVKHSFQPGVAVDVIARNQLALVMLLDGIQLYSYDQQFNVQPLGKINYN